MLQLGTILNSKSFAITVADTRFISPNPSNYPNFDFLLIKARAEVISCILHDKILYFSKAVSAWSFQAAACALLVQLNIILAKPFLSRALDKRT
ncbi:hypothetical protein AB3S75_039126 [Citrus x aurantiifolia]